MLHCVGKVMFYITFKTSSIIEKKFPYELKKVLEFIYFEALVEY